MLLLETEKIIQNVRHFFPDVYAIYLFGSYSKQNASHDSDIDLAFFGPNPYTKEQILQLSLFLASQFNKDFDCIDLKNTNTAFATHIIDSGKLIYGFEENKNEIISFEITLMSMYANLNEERKDIIDDVLKRGSIYGR